MPNDLKWTGERLVTDKHGDIVQLHLHRYALALEFAAGKTVLDIASGEGYGSSLLAKKARHVVGVDISREAVDFANQKYAAPNLKFIEGSTSNIPLENDAVDVVVSFETIEHHSEHEEMMREIKRVLRDDGILIISSPDKENYTIIPGHINPFHVKELYKEEFKDLINRYFKQSVFYSQRMYYASMMIDEEGNDAPFKEYDGDFNQLRAVNGLGKPVYNICLASDSAIKEGRVNSVFNANDIFHEIQMKETEIYNSKTYRLGNLLLFPYRLIQRMLK